MKYVYTARLDEQGRLVKEMAVPELGITVSAVVQAPGGAHLSVEQSLWLANAVMGGTLTRDWEAGEKEQAATLGG